MKNITTILKVLLWFVKENFLNVLSLLVSVLLVVSGSIGEMERSQLIFFDIGQGDAILVQKERFQILIDGGPDDSIVYKLPRYMPWFDNYIDVVVLTHPHDDHLVGILHLLSRYEVGKILYNPTMANNQNYDYLLAEYENLLTPVSYRYLVEYGDLSLKILYPFDINDAQSSNLNNESLVALLEVDDYRILLMGDAEVEVEEELLGEDLGEIYMLKVGHHCSRTSTSEMFLKTVGPEVAICSVSRENKFGHPHYETIEKFSRYNVQYLVTYEEGDIVIKF